MRGHAETLATVTALVELRDGLHRLPLALELAGAAEARDLRRELAGQIDDYLLPRLRQMDAPLLMVVGGSTGAGKSTLVNSLVGFEVSRGRRAAADHPRAGARLPPRRPRLVRGRPHPARAAAHHRGGDGGGRRVARARRRPTGCRPAWRCSTRRTSTRWWRPTATLAAPAARRGRRVAVRHDARPATPTRCRGTCCWPRASAAPRSRWCSTACRPTGAGDRRAPAGDAAPSAVWATPSCSSCPSRRCATAACPGPRWRPCGRGWTGWPVTRRRAPSSSGARSAARWRACRAASASSRPPARRSAPPRPRSSGR